MDGMDTTDLSQTTSISPKALGKRKLDEALAPNGHVHVETTAERPIAGEQRGQLLAAFELIDCHGLLDAPLPDNSSLRQVIASETSSFSQLETALTSAHSSVKAQVEALPPFPFNPVEPQYKNATTRRTDEEMALVQEIGETRQVMTDKEATRQEQLEEWLRRARSLAAGSYRGVQGKGSVPPLGAVKQEPLTSSVEASTSKRIVLHRSLAGLHDVFTSVNIGELSRHAHQMLNKMPDTDVLVDAALPPATALRSANVNLGAVNAPFEDASAPREGSDPIPVEYLDYGPFDSFAPTYDSSSCTLSYSASVKLKRAREEAQAELSKPLVLSKADADIELASLRQNASLARLPATRLARTAALLRRMQVSQYNRLKSTPVVESPTTDETTDAHVLHDELAGLLNEAAGHGLSLDTQALRALHPGATRPAFHGMLDPRSTKGLREGVLTMLPPGK